MKLADNTKVSSATKSEHCILEKVTLGPREGVRVPLGIYEADMPEPDFQLGYDHDEPISTDIAAALERIDREDEYQLVYFFQNFTDKTYKIIVRELCM